MKLEIFSRVKNKVKTDLIHIKEINNLKKNIRKVIKKDLKWQPNIPIEKGVKFILKEINYWKKAPIWTPKKITEEEKKLLMKLKNSSNFKPNPSKSDRSFFDKLRDFI